MSALTDLLVRILFALDANSLAQGRVLPGNAAVERKGLARLDRVCQRQSPAMLHNLNQVVFSTSMCQGSYPVSVHSRGMPPKKKSADVTAILGVCVDEFCRKCRTQSANCSRWKNQLPETCAKELTLQTSLNASEATLQPSEKLERLRATSRF